MGGGLALGISVIAFVVVTKIVSTVTSIFIDAIFSGPVPISGTSFMRSAVKPHWEPACVQPVCRLSSS
jgi:hypothetical protein